MLIRIVGAVLLVSGCATEVGPDVGSDARGDAPSDAGTSADKGGSPAPDRKVADLPVDTTGYVAPLALTVETVPVPPALGKNTFYIAVKDGAGKLVSAATVTVSTFMPSMGHGSTPPAVTAQSDGRFKAYPVSFTMPGEWQVTVNSSFAALSKKAVFNYVIK